MGVVKTQGRGGARGELQYLVRLGHLSPADADEIGETLDLLDDMVQLGALSVEQGNAIIGAMADDKAQEYLTALQSGEWTEIKFA